MYVKKSFIDLKSLVDCYEGSGKDNECQRILAQLWHLYDRTSHISVMASSNSANEKKKEIEEKPKQLIDMLQQTENFPSSFTPEVPLKTDLQPTASLVTTTPTQT